MQPLWFCLHLPAALCAHLRLVKNGRSSVQITAKVRPLKNQRPPTDTSTHYKQTALCASEDLAVLHVLVCGLFGCVQSQL